MREEILIEACAARPLRRIDIVSDDAVLIANAEALVADLLALVTAADVEAEHAHTRRLTERRPEVGSRRNGGELCGAELVADGGRRSVDDRRLGGHRQGFLHGGHFELHVDRQRASERQHDVLALHWTEALQVEGQNICSRRQRRKQELPVFLRHHDLVADQGRRGGCYGDSRKKGPLRV